MQDIDPDPGSNNQCTDDAINDLDWIQTKVYYSSTTIDAAAENADGDNFYISPTSADLEEIFQNIGKAVCPALGTPPSPPPTNANLAIINYVINDNGGIQPTFPILQ